MSGPTPEPVTCPDCGRPVCVHCASRFGMTRQHLKDNGTCPYGHRSERRSEGMNPLDRQNIPVGTPLHEQDSNGPVKAFRDYDTLLLDRWRLSIEEVIRLQGILSGTLPDMIAARAEMREEAAEDEDAAMEAAGNG